MNGTKLSKVIPKIRPDQLAAALQQAIELEIATIPVYLYTYYSINRTPNQKDLIKAITKDLPKKMPAKKKAAFAKKYALQLQVYSNKAGSLIMSVVVEEMLHMALSSNVKQALFGPPKLAGCTPVFPTALPGHIPPFPINLAKFSMNQLMTFLKIESPLHFREIDTGTVGKSHSLVATGTHPFEYDTIGDFYKGIENCINKNFKANKHYQRKATPKNPTAQLISRPGYYGQNNIDTVYYDAKHKPQFPNASDSGGLVHVKSRATAIEALAEVVEQGEGLNVDGVTGDHLTENGKVSPALCKRVNAGDFSIFDYDDKNRGELKELSHFDRFLELYCNGQKLSAAFKKATGKEDFEFEKYFVRDVPNNPIEKKIYKGKENASLLAVSKLTNAVYTYLFLMTEACYYHDDHTQFEIFMFGIHKSMLWILNNLCADMMGLNYPVKQKATFAAPTFEDYDFSKDKKRSPKEQLIQLATKAGPNYKTVLDRIKVLPDVSLNLKVAATL